jgi:hypothetical protein
LAGWVRCERHRVVHGAPLAHCFRALPSSWLDQSVPAGPAWVPRLNVSVSICAPPTPSCVRRARATISRQSTAGGRPGCCSSSCSRSCRRRGCAAARPPAAPLPQPPPRALGWAAGSIGMAAMLRRLRRCRGCSSRHDCGCWPSPMSVPGMRTSCRCCCEAAKCSCRRRAWASASRCAAIAAAAAAADRAPGVVLAAAATCCAAGAEHGGVEDAAMQRAPHHAKGCSCQQVPPRMVLVPPAGVCRLPAQRASATSRTC